MKYKKVFWGDCYSINKDNNNGLIYGIEENTELPNYIEWFRTEEERENYILKNNLEVLKNGKM